MQRSPKTKARPTDAPPPVPAKPADPADRPGPSGFGDWYEYEARLQRPLVMKLADFRRSDRLRHVIFSRQFDIPLLLMNMTRVVAAAGGRLAVNAEVADVSREPDGGFALSVRRDGATVRSQQDGLPCPNARRSS